MTGIKKPAMEAFIALSYTIAFKTQQMKHSLTGLLGIPPEVISAFEGFLTYLPQPLCVYLEK